MEKRRYGVGLDFFNTMLFRVLFGLGVPGLAACGAVFLYRFGSPFQCMFYRFTGLYCPGCGAGRALYALVHGKVFRALGYNLMFCAVMPFIAYYFLKRYIQIVFHRDPLPLPAITLGTYHKVMFVILAYWVLRNVSCYPFSLLAPTV